MTGFVRVWSAARKTGDWSLLTSAATRLRTSRLAPPVVAAHATPDLKGLVAGAPNSMMTNIAGLYAFGEVNYQYHGGTRLGANALLSCIFDGLFCGAGVANYAAALETATADVPASLFAAASAQEEAKMQRLIDGAGEENPYEIGWAMGDVMTAASTVVKTEDRMLEAMKTLHELEDRAARLRLSDTGLWTNQNLSYARALADMLKLAEVILLGGIRRKESRGSHYRPDYPERDDEQFLKTTIARYDPGTGRPELWYEDVEIGLVPPRTRSYGKVEETTAAKGR
jgi:succinate dehydrogenase / fumarate reductase flavoprotein subunit